MSADVRSSADLRSTVWEFDIQNYYHTEQDPFEAFLEYRECEPFWCESVNGFWVFSRYEECRDIMQDHSLFSHVGAGVPPMDLEYPLVPSEYDPPYQTKLRSVILPLMTAAKMDRLEPRMHSVCRELIAGFKDSGNCDMVVDFARRYPIAIFGDLFGLPNERREEFRILAETFLHDLDAQESAWNSIREIIRDELEVALQEWHAALPDYRVVPDSKFTYHGGSVFAIEHLPLEWDV